MRTDRPLTLTVTEAGLLLGVSRSTAYELVRSGELDSIRLRRRVVVPVAVLAERLGIEVSDVWTALVPDAVADRVEFERVSGRVDLAVAAEEFRSIATGDR